MYKPKFHKTPLAAAVALALGAVAISPVYAQDAADDADDAGEEGILEVVMVTGVRNSLIRSMDRKREASGVVDAITSEDLGKFPDQNLAEALQRIPGVSIDRSNNEGSQITVRGMGPEFNLVTLNGRSMPTQGGRSFDFADIATPGISAVEVVKTGRADLPTGGIGATVNMITARPLQTPGFKGFVSAKAVHETSASDGNLGDLDKFTPEVAGMLSSTFADDTIGVLISGAYQVRHNREENASVDSWIPNFENGLNGGEVIDNNQREDGVWWHPQNAGYGFSDIQRERINGQAVLQWAPSDRFTATLDYTYSEVDVEKDSNGMGVWFQNPNVTATVNERGTVTNVTQSTGDYATNVSRDHTIKENESIGLNLAWDATDTLSLQFDAHDSSSTLKGAGLGGGVPGSSANVIIGNTFCDWCGFVPGAGRSTANIGEKSASYGANGIPIWDMTFVNTETGLPQAALLPSDIGSLFGQAFNTDVSNDITQLQLSGSWDNDGGGAITSIDFGLSSTDQDFTDRNAASGLLPAGFWLTSAQYWPDENWELASISGLLDGFSNSGDYPVDYYYVAPFDYIVDIYESLDASGDPVGTGVYWPGWAPDFQDPAGGRGRFWSGPLGNASGAGINEKVEAAYIQFNLEDEFHGMPFKSKVGVRYEKSTTTSTGDEVAAQAVIWVGGNEMVTDYASESSFVTGRGSDTQILPSIDMSLEVTEDMVTRFSYSRTLARPPIGAMSPVRAFIANPKIGNRKVTVGNPDLIPYVSDNIDLSFEWYYAEGSFASVGYFRKIVNNFLQSTTIQEAYDGIYDPYFGVDAEMARVQLSAEGIDLTDQNVFARINENRGVNPTTPVAGLPGDPLVVWDVTTTTNSQAGTIDGFEFQVQHMFGDSGFGFQANATIVNGDINANPDVIGIQFALQGLSDSANLIAFYENEHISTRLAYNWRDKFLSGFDQHDSPNFVEAYSSLDINLTWNATDRLSVFLEGVNVTEETQRTYTRYPEQFLRGNQYGARYNIGASFTF